MSSSRPRKHAVNVCTETYEVYWTLYAPHWKAWRLSILSIPDFLSLIFATILFATIAWTISNYDCGEQNSCTFAPVPPTTMDQLAICSACDQNAGLWRCSVLAQQRALFLECGFDTSTRSAQIFGLSSFQKGLSIATSSQRMSSLLGNLGIATLKSYICKTAMLLSTRARSVFTIGHHWTVSKRGTPALISEDFTTAQELGTKMHEVRLTNH